MDAVTPVDLGLATIAVIIIKIVLDFVRDILKRDDKNAIAEAEEAKAVAVKEAAREAADVTRESARRAELDSHRKEWREEMRILEAGTRDQVREIVSGMASLTGQTSELIGTVRESQRRNERFHEHDWPMMVASMNHISRRVGDLEINHEVIRERIGMGPTPTPADGVRVRLGQPIDLNIPAHVKDEG